MINQLNKYFSEINNLAPFKKGINLFLIIISSLLTLHIFALTSADLFQTSAPKGIVFATDNDGGRAIETSLQTKWYNSNHFAPYGNIYFRLGHTIADTIKLPAEELSELETREKAHHFALKIISLISLMALGAFLGWIIFKDYISTLFFTPVFTVLMMNNIVWVEFIIRPHPDHLLLLTVAIASYLTAKYLRDEEDKKYFILSAFAWGLAMAVKRSVSLYIPGIFFILLFPWGKHSLKKLLHYIGYMLIPYLIIGFPQNFGFYKHIKFLLYESHNHRMANWDSFSTNLSLMIEQLLPITGLILIASFFSSQRIKLLSWKFSIFILISLLPILGRRMLSPGHHHTLPIVTTIIILIILIVLQVNKIRLTKFNHLIVCFLAITFLNFNTPFSKAYNEIKNWQSKCVSDAKEIVQLMRGHVNATNKLVKEPYFPFSSDFGKSVLSYWGLKWSDIDANTGFFGIKKDISQLYRQAPPESIHISLRDGWDQKIEFYKSIWDKTEVISPTGDIFKKIHEDECGFQLWKK